MKTEEEFYCKVYQSPRLPLVVLTPNLQYGRQDPPDPDARTSTDHQSEQSVYRKNLSLTSRGHTSQASRRKSAMEIQGNLSR